MITSNEQALDEERRRQEEDAALAKSLKIAAYADAMRYADRTAILEGHPSAKGRDATSGAPMGEANDRLIASIKEAKKQAAAHVESNYRGD